MTDRRRGGTRHWGLAGLAALLLALAPVGDGARAEPTVWTQAARPDVAARARTVRQVDRLLARARNAEAGDALARASRSLLLRDALGRLAKVAAARSDDPRLRHQLARVHYGLFELDGDGDHLRAAAVHLAKVARAAVPITVQAEALNDLAMCHARLGQHEQEIRAYQRALAIEPHAESQAILLANQAEGFMASGDIQRAVVGYRASIAATPAYALHRIAVTTWWGYAVALDRSGNLMGALEQIGKARSYDPEDLRLNSDSWVYLPGYDEHWYQALGHWHRARSATEPQQELAALDRAVAAWSAYLQSAVPDDRWLALAGIRLRQCEQERRRALERRGTGAPTPDADTAPDETP